MKEEGVGANAEMVYHIPADVAATARYRRLPAGEDLFKLGAVG